MDVRRPRIYNTIADAILQIQHGVSKWLPCLWGFNVYRFLPNQQAITFVVKIGNVQEEIEQLL